MNRKREMAVQLRGILVVVGWLLMKWCKGGGFTYKRCRIMYFGEEVGGEESWRIYSVDLVSVVGTTVWSCSFYIKVFGTYQKSLLNINEKHRMANACKSKIRTDDRDHTYPLIRQQLYISVRVNQRSQNFISGHLCLFKS